MVSAPGGCIVWFTGMSAAGKTTLCRAVAAALTASGRQPIVLDGDELRQTLCSDLGYSRADREENVRRVGALAFTHARVEAIVLVALISPYRDGRGRVKQASPVPFLEVFVDAPLSVCEERDPKGLYRSARAGVLKEFTGIDEIYEAPVCPDVHCRTANESVAESCARVLAALAHA